MSLSVSQQLKTIIVNIISNINFINYYYRCVEKSKHVVYQSCKMFNMYLVISYLNKLLA